MTPDKMREHTARRQLFREKLKSKIASQPLNDDQRTDVFNTLAEYDIATNEMLTEMCDAVIRLGDDLLAKL